MSRPLPKLRSTCRACSDSKVKCDKKKPACSRCLSRCVPCEYVQARRPGRVPGALNRSSAHTSKNRSVSTLHDNNDNILDTDDHHHQDSLPPHSSTGFHLGCPWDPNHTHPGLLMSSPPDDILSEDEAAMNIDPLLLFGMDDMAHEAPDFLATLDMLPAASTDNSGALSLTLPMNNYKSTNVHHGPDASDMTGSSEGFHSSSVSLDDTFSLHAGLDNVDSSEYTSISNSDTAQSPLPYPPDLPSIQASPQSSKYTCQCMLQALGMLKALSAIPMCPDARTPNQDFAALFVQNNNRDITAILNMLECDLCKEDSFLFMIILMLTTKILARYASTVSVPSTATSHSSSSSSAYSVSGLTDKYTARLADISHALGATTPWNSKGDAKDDLTVSLREAAQHVLRELHLIQRLISQLATRSKQLDRAEPKRNASQSQLPNENATSQYIGSNGHEPNHLASTFMATFREEISTPLNVRTFDLMIGDMQRSVAMLSVVLRGLLRNS